MVEVAKHYTPEVVEDITGIPAAADTPELLKFSQRTGRQV
jgi:anaerobic selenocysteine-containing dehydrogenase